MIRIEILGGSMAVRLGKMVGLTAPKIASSISESLAEGGVTADVKVISGGVVEVHTSGLKGMFQGTIKKKIEAGLREKGVEARVSVV